MSMPYSTAGRSVPEDIGLRLLGELAHLQRDTPDIELVLIGVLPEQTVQPVLDPQKLVSRAVYSPGSSGCGSTHTTRTLAIIVGHRPDGNPRTASQHASKFGRGDPCHRRLSRTTRS
jgi:hypothetical protein